MVCWFVLLYFYRRNLLSRLIIAMVIRLQGTPGDTLELTSSHFIIKKNFN